MIRFQADADLDHGIVLAVRRREPAIDFASASDSAIAGLTDPEVLEVAAQQGRVLVTHDRRTMPGHFRDRIAGGETSPGVFLVSQFEPIGPVVETLLLVWTVSTPAEWRNQIRHLPRLSAHVFGTR